jgi:hypothetical protein
MLRKTGVTLVMLSSLGLVSSKTMGDPLHTVMAIGLAAILVDSIRHRRSAR